MMPLHPQSCQTARARATHDLDGELSELEGHLLRWHLERCPDCAVFAAEIAATASMLRTTPLERFSVELSFRRRRPRHSFQRIALGAATGLAAVVVMGVATSTYRSEDPRLRPPAGGSGAEIVPTVPGESPRGVPLTTRILLPIGQRNAVNDF
jgi:anti-sigma factor RsiW